MIKWFRSGSCEDYQRPNGYIAAVFSSSNFVGAYTNVTFYNYGAVSAAAGYSLEDTLNNAGLYNTFFGNATGTNSTGLRQNAVNSISQGWSDYQLSGIWH